MYLTKDITNILESKKDCIKKESDKVCTSVKSGNFYIDLNEITTFQSLEYLLSIVKTTTTDCVVNTLIDCVQDICDGCVTTTITTTTTTGCVKNAILGENGDCLLNELGQPLILE